jgi:Mg2+-importing ATPase
MLMALGLAVNPAPVFASFMLSTLTRTLGVVPGGLGVFEAVSVPTLKLIGVPVAAGLAATLRPLFHLLAAHGARADPGMA